MVAVVVDAVIALVDVVVGERDRRREVGGMREAASKMPYDSGPDPNSDSDSDSGPGPGSGSGPGSGPGPAVESMNADANANVEQFYR